MCIEINDNLCLSKISIVKFLKTLPTVLIVKKQILMKEILEVVNSFLIIIYILFNFKVFFILPKSFYGPLTIRLYYHWSIDHHNALKFITV